MKLFDALRRSISSPIGVLKSRLPGAVRRWPRTTAAIVVGLVAVGLVVIANPAGTRVSGEPPAAGGATAGPSFTYARTWSLLELQQHIASGEVVAITAPDAATGVGADGKASASPAPAIRSTARLTVPDPATGDADILAARTRDGQVVRIALTVSPGDAVLALAGMGHGGLLTSEAWQAARTADPTAAAAAPEAPVDPLRAILGLLIPLLAIALIVTFAMRFARRASATASKPDPAFKTIMPASPLQPGQVVPTTRAGGAASGAAPVPSVSLADVAGCDEAKTELTETIEFLRTPEKFRRLGARIPRGIMLYGPPGTGKTMLARAVAAEAGVPFHYASGSEFVEKYVGVGAKRIRDLFAQARRLGAGVIFFDEFDALGKSRGGANSHEEREQTLNQLLVELDGFGSSEDIVVIAATNRIDVLDAAVLRPGRFNRKIHVGLPDVVGRREILDVHARNKPLTVTTDLEAVARKTYGFSGAMLADLLNEAAILAARRGGDAITPEDLHDGWLKVAVGTSRRRSMDERERSIIAAHEVGHAICGRVHGDKRKVEEISLFAHGEALGVTVSSQEDNDLPAESDLRARLVALMGGRAAEELLFHEVTGGASNDFEKANQIATSMVTKWGMGRDPEAAAGDLGTTGRGSLGFLVAGDTERMSGEVQAVAVRAIRALLDEAYAEACATLVEHMATLRRLAAYLVEHERMDGETFDALFGGSVEVPNAEAEWRPTAARPRAWTEIGSWATARRLASGTREVPASVAPGRLPAPGPHLPAPTPAPTRDAGPDGPVEPVTSKPAARGGAVPPSTTVAQRGGQHDRPAPEGRTSRTRRRRIAAPVLGRAVSRGGSAVSRGGAAVSRGGAAGKARSGEPAVRRPSGTGRRLRSLAAGYLHRAETWLAAPGETGRD